MALIPPGVNMALAGAGGGGGGGVLWIVESKSYSSPPGVPALDDQYIVKSPGSGVWLGHDNEIAKWDGTSWIFTAPLEGDLAYVKDEDAYYGWNGLIWFPLSCCPKRFVATYFDGAYHAIGVISVPDDRVIHIVVRVAARRTDASDRAGYTRWGLFYREGGGACFRQGPTSTPFARESDGRYDVTLEPSGNTIEIRVRGRAGHTVNWSVAYTTEEVS